MDIYRVRRLELFNFKRPDLGEAICRDGYGRFSACKSRKLRLTQNLWKLQTLWSSRCRIFSAHRSCICNTFHRFTSPLHHCFLAFLLIIPVLRSMNLSCFCFVVCFSFRSRTNAKIFNWSKPQLNRFGKHGTRIVRWIWPAHHHLQPRRAYLSSR